MVKNFVTYELAVKLKELGFNESCLSYWETESKLQYCFNHNSADGMKKDVSAPLWQQAFDWFREKHEILCVISRGYGYEYLICDDNHQKKEIAGDGTYNTYEEARLACLQELIKIVESWNTQKK